MTLSTSTQVVGYRVESEQADAMYAWAPLAGTSLPVVVFIHGSHTNPRMYTKYASLLAESGFIVVAPEQEREVFGDFAHYPQQAFVNWALEFVEAENLRPQSPIAGRVDRSQVFLVGHSMGGGTTLGVVGDFSQPGLSDQPWSVPSELKAAVVNATHNIPPPRTGDPVPVTNSVPLAFMQGSVDDVVTLDQAARTFAAVNGVLPRAFVTIEGGNHFFLTDVDNPEGANPDRASMQWDQDASVEAAAKWTANWFRANSGSSQAVALLQGESLSSNVRVELIGDL